MKKVNEINFYQKNNFNKLIKSGSQQINLLIKFKKIYKIYKILKKDRDFLYNLEET